MNLQGCSLLLAAVALCATLAAHAQDSSPQLQSLLESGQVDQAIGELEDQLGNNPYDPVSLNNLAVAKSRQNEPYVALDLLRRAMRLSPSQPVIAQNYEKLRSWLAARIGAADPVVDTHYRRPPPVQLPDPPPLWK